MRCFYRSCSRSRPQHARLASLSYYTGVRREKQTHTEGERERDEDLLVFCCRIPCWASCSGVHGNFCSGCLDFYHSTSSWQVVESSWLTNSGFSALCSGRRHDTNSSSTTQIPVHDLCLRMRLVLRFVNHLERSLDQHTRHAQQQSCCCFTLSAHDGLCRPAPLAPILPYD